MRAIIFLIQSIGLFYAYLLIARAVIEFQRSSPFHPLTQFVRTLTDALILPLRNLIKIKAFWLALILYALLCLLLIAVIHSLYHGPLISADVLALQTVILMVGSFIRFWTYVVLIYVIMSWVAPQHPVHQMLGEWSWPILRHIRKIIPTIGGLDLSPILFFLVAQAVLIYFPNPLRYGFY